LIPAPLLLGGCATAPGPGSVATGECKVFEAPRYAVKGARPYDQDWIDSTVEGGVGACKWQRPAARPAELDTPPRAAKPKVATVKPKKNPLWVRMLHWRKSAPPAAPTEASPTLTVLPAEPDAPAPRSAIDELLSPVR
jgi:hypothetical protein